MSKEIPFYCEFVDVQKILTFQRWAKGDSHNVEGVILKYGNAVRHKDVDAARFWYLLMSAFIRYRSSGPKPPEGQTRKPGTDPFYKFERAFRKSYTAGTVPPW